MFDWLSVDGDETGSAHTARIEKTGIVTQGLVAGTRVASNLGWRVVEALAPGDKVLTFDRGMQILQEVRREVLWVGARNVPQHHWPVTVPAGALQNRCDITLMPDQGVVIESDVADDVYQDPFAVISARQLVGLRGITQTPPRAQVEVITLIFEHDEVVYAEGGTLIHCPMSGDLLSHCLMQAAANSYNVLDCEMAALALDELVMEDALRSHGSGHAIMQDIRVA